MKKSLFTVVAFLVLCTSSTFAQGEAFINTNTSFNLYDFDFVGGGVRAKGMGNAFIGVSNDVTGGTWNPAGLFEIDATVIGLSRFSMNPKGVTTLESFTNTTIANHSGSTSGWATGNLVSPIRISGHPFVFSINLTRNFMVFEQSEGRLNLDQEFVITTNLGVEFVDTNNVDIRETIRNEGGLNSLNIAFGTRLYDKISFGIATNVYYGTSVLKIEDNVSIPNLRLIDIQRADFNSNISIEDSNKFSGANFTVGFMYNGDKLDAGLTIRTPFNLDENRDHAIYTITEINGLATGTDTTFFGDQLFQYEMPLMIGTGVGYQVNEKWLLAADIEYRNFSGKKVNQRVSRTVNPGSSNIDSFIVIDPVWNNSFTVRLGTEYLKSFDFGTVPFRAGFGYIPLPGPSIDAFGNFTTVVQHNFTLGTGIHWEQIKFDIAYQYRTSNFDVGGESLVFDYKNHNINFSFTGVF